MSKNLNYWLWRWAHLGPLGRCLTSLLVLVPAFAILGCLLLLAAIPGAFVVGVCLASNRFGPAYWYNDECRRNDICGRGYRVYWDE